jgi:hypothetical protein
MDVMQQQISYVHFGPKAPQLEAFLGEVGSLLGNQRWDIAKRRRRDASDRHMLVEAAHTAARGADRETHRAEGWARGAAASGVPFNMSGNDLVSIQDAAAEAALALVIWDLDADLAGQLYSIVEPEISRAILKL